MSKRATRTEPGRHSGGSPALFLLLMLAAGACAAGLLWLGPGTAQLLGPPGPALNPAEILALQAYLRWRAADLLEPLDPNAADVTFSVEPGETARGVTARLQAAGLVRDANVVNYYLRYTGLDGRIEAGEFRLSAAMPARDLAHALTDASARQVSARLFEGWRLEQIAAALASNPGLSVDQHEFLGLAGPSGPHTGYSFSGDLPPGASVEGYLFPDTYLFDPGAAAPEVYVRLLLTFDARLPASYRSDVTNRGLTLHQAVTMASLIEREAAVDDERPVIASVMFNRLAAGQWLEIDASVQYALGQPDQWWPPLKGLDLRTIVSPYNTYAGPGLPPGPIASPGLPSLLAVAQPAQTGYYYYRARCDGSGRHNFSVTYEEHLGYACP